MDERLKFVARLLDGEKMALVCREFGISRKTGYKIFSRYKDTGLEGLHDRSRRPQRHANQLPFQVERQILAIKREHPSWGVPKIREKLIRTYPQIKPPAKNTVHAVLDRHGLVKTRQRRRYKVEREAIHAYFKDPTGTLAGQGGGLNAPGVGEVGPGGANAGLINWNNPLSQPERTQDPLAAAQTLEQASDAAVAKEAAARKQKSLDTLQAELEKELSRDDSAFIKLRDQILIDQTALGLRIQIVDKKNRPMFDIGSPKLQIYAQEVLRALAPRLNAVQNKLSVNGHTDAVP